MAADLRFDITARDSASGEFLAVAAELRELARQLDALDRKRANAQVKVTGTAEGQAQVRGLDGQLRDLDGRFAKAKVGVDGAAKAETETEAVKVALKGIPNTTTAHVQVDVDNGMFTRLGSLATKIRDVQTVAGSAAGQFQRFRQAAGMLIDPGTIPLVERASAAIRDKFHTAVDAARGVVEKLSTGLKGLDVSLLGLAAVGKVATVIVGVGEALAQLSGIALLAPAALGGVGVAFGVAKLATTGFTDALTGSAKKQAEAYAAMGTEARKLVDALKSLGPAANDFRKAVQDTAVKGLAAEVKTLAGTYLPLLKSGLTGVAAGFNAMAKGAIVAVQSTTALSAVRTVIAATSAAIGNMPNALGNVVSGFLTLAGAGSRGMGSIGTAIESATRQFQVWTQVITRTGQFDAWVNAAKTGFSQLGTIFGNLGSVGGAALRALNQNGAGLLQTLAASTTQMKAFVQSAQGSSALNSLAQMAAAAGQALSNVLGAALRALSPVIVTLTPVVTALATAFGEHLVKVINLVAPALQKFATELAKHPQLIADLAVKLHTAVTVFGPFVAALGLAVGILQKMIIARIATAALTALGLAGTGAGAALMFLVSPLSALSQLMPTLAAAIGRAGASFALLAGPIGWLIVGFATLYASSAQFRDAMNQIGATFGQIFMKALRDAGQAIASTVTMITDLGAAIGSALSGIGSAATSTMSIFGPFGDAVSSILSTIFGALSNLPGVALAAFAAFVVFGKVAPIFTAASAAVAGFAARMTAYSASTALGAAASNTLGAAAGKVSTVLSKMGAALPILGVALIALGAIYDQVSAKTDEWAAGLIKGGDAATQAQAAIQKYNDQFVEGSILGNMFRLTQADVNAEVEKQIGLLGPVEQAQARAALAQTAWNNAVRDFGPESMQAKAAAEAYSAANSKLTDEQKKAAEAAKTHEQKVKELADTMRSQIGAMLDYADAVRRTADAHKEAGDALKENGKNSAEYAKATDDIIRAADSQAQAAASQAKAWGAADDGIAAYNTELLRAFDLSTTQGRDAFVKMASGLDDAGRAALSAQAHASGLRTEIIQLPNGKKIEVVVAADQGKLPEVKAQVNEIAGKKWVGRVEIIAETENLRGDIDQVLRLVDGTTAKLHVDAETGQALLTVNNTKYEIDKTTGTLKVLGDVAPGEADLSGFKAKIDQTTGKVTAILDPTSANAGVEGLKQKIDGIVGIAKADLDSTPAGAKADQMKAYIDGITAILKADADITPGTAKGTELQNHISGLIAIMTADADYAPGKAKGDELRAYISSLIGIMEAQANTDPATQQGRDAKAYIDGLKALIKIDGNADAAVQAARNALAAIGGLPAAVINITKLITTVTRSGGGVVGYSGGGIADRIHRAARGMVLPGYAPGQDTELSLLSKGEAVLVPELVRSLGARRIMAANAEASGGRPGANTGSLAAIMDGRIGRPSGRVAAAAGPRGSGSTTIVAPPDLGPLLSRIGSLEKTIATAMNAARPISVAAAPGGEMEAARAVRLALR